MSLLGSVTKVTTPWLAAVEPFWPIIWRVLVVIAVFWAGWHYGGKEAERDLEEFKVAQALATSNAVKALGDEIAARQVELTTQEIESATTIAELKATQAATPAPTLRVCKQASPRPMPSISRDTGDDAPLDGGERGFSEGVGVDIGPRVQQLVNRAVIVQTKCLQQEARSDFLSSQEPLTIPVK